MKLVEKLEDLLEVKFDADKESYMLMDKSQSTWEKRGRFLITTRHKTVASANKYLIEKSQADYYVVKADILNVGDNVEKDKKKFMSRLKKIVAGTPYEIQGDWTITNIGGYDFWNSDGIGGNFSVIIKRK